VRATKKNSILVGGVPEAGRLGASFVTAVPLVDYILHFRTLVTVAEPTNLLAGLVEITHFGAPVVLAHRHSLIFPLHSGELVFAAETIMMFIFVTEIRNQLATFVLTRGIVHHEWTTMPNRPTWHKTLTPNPEKKTDNITTCDNT
jgi:hypothetical protein